VVEQVGFSQVEFGRRWHIHSKTLSKWRRRGLIRPSLRIGKLIRYRDEDLLKADLSTRAAELRAAILLINFGRDVSEVASLLTLRPETVRRHLRQAWMKLKVRHDG
jgi:DNA-directed RNA polymerase specialized sigma24 family protein